MGSQTQLPSVSENFRECEISANTYGNHNCNCSLRFQFHEFQAVAVCKSEGNQISLHFSQARFVYFGIAAGPDLYYQYLLNLAQALLAPE